VAVHDPWLYALSMLPGTSVDGASKALLKERRVRVCEGERL
jgi:hypothetical protein